MGGNHDDDMKHMQIVLLRKCTKVCIEVMCIDKAEKNTYDRMFVL